MTNAQKRQEMAALYGYRMSIKVYKTCRKSRRAAHLVFLGRTEPGAFSPSKGD